MMAALEGYAILVTWLLDAQADVDHAVVRYEILIYINQFFSVKCNTNQNIIDVTLYNMM
jgi:hypothetical protein